jgi:hypothetical protein
MHLKISINKNVVSWWIVLLLLQPSLKESPLKASVSYFKGNYFVTNIDWIALIPHWDLLSLFCAHFPTVETGEMQFLASANWLENNYQHAI